MELSTILLNWLLNQDKNSPWYLIVNTDVTKAVLGSKLDRLKETKSENKILSEEEINKLREDQDNNLKVVKPPNWRYFCNNPACQYHSEVNSKINEVCARCENVPYCSPQCQRIHWRVHKFHCSKEE